VFIGPFRLLIQPKTRPSAMDIPLWDIKGKKLSLCLSTTLWRRIGGLEV